MMGCSNTAKVPRVLPSLETTGLDEMRDAILSIGMVPTGTADPYALRRSAIETRATKCAIMPAVTA